MANCLDGLTNITAFYIEFNNEIKDLIEIFLDQKFVSFLDIKLTC